MVSPEIEQAKILTKLKDEALNLIGCDDKNVIIKFNTRMAKYWGDYDPNFFRSNNNIEVGRIELSTSLFERENHHKLCETLIRECIRHKHKDTLYLADYLEHELTKIDAVIANDGTLQSTKENGKFEQFYFNHINGIELPLKIRTHRKQNKDGRLTKLINFRNADFALTNLALIYSTPEMINDKTFKQALGVTRNKQFILGNQQAWEPSAKIRMRLSIASKVLIASYHSMQPPRAKRKNLDNGFKS